MRMNVQLSVEKDVLSVPDMAEILGVSRSMVYSMVNSGQIPSVKVGSKVKFIKSQIEVWLADGGSKEEVV